MTWLPASVLVSRVMRSRARWTACSSIFRRSLPMAQRSRSLRPNRPEALEIMRHSAAHIMAEAVQALYPDVLIAFGPATEDGLSTISSCRIPSPRTISKRSSEDGRDHCCERAVRA